MLSLVLQQLCMCWNYSSFIKKSDISIIKEVYKQNICFIDLNYDKLELIRSRCVFKFIEKLYICLNYGLCIRKADIQIIKNARKSIIYTTDLNYNKLEFMR